MVAEKSSLLMTWQRINDTTKQPYSDVLKTAVEQVYGKGPKSILGYGFDIINIPKHIELIVKAPVDLLDNVLAPLGEETAAKPSAAAIAGAEVETDAGTVNNDEKKLSASTSSLTTASTVLDTGAGMGFSSLPALEPIQPSIEETTSVVAKSPLPPKQKIAVRKIARAAINVLRLPHLLIRSISSPITYVFQPLNQLRKDHPQVFAAVLITTLLITAFIAVSVFSGGMPAFMLGIALAATHAGTAMAAVAWLAWMGLAAAIIVAKAAFIVGTFLVSGKILQAVATEATAVNDYMDSSERSERLLSTTKASDTEITEEPKRLTEKDKAFLKACNKRYKEYEQKALAGGSNITVLTAEDEQALAGYLLGEFNFSPSKGRLGIINGIKFSYPRAIFRSPHKLFKELICNPESLGRIITVVTDMADAIAKREPEQQAQNAADQQRSYLQTYTAIKNDLLNNNYPLPVIFGNQETLGNHETLVGYLLAQNFANADTLRQQGPQQLKVNWREQWTGLSVEMQINILDSSAKLLTLKHENDSKQAAIARNRQVLGLTTSHDINLSPVDHEQANHEEKERSRLEEGRRLDEEANKDITPNKQFLKFDEPSLEVYLLRELIQGEKKFCQDMSTFAQMLRTYESELIKFSINGASEPSKIKSLISWMGSVISTSDTSEPQQAAKQPAIPESASINVPVVIGRYEYIAGKNVFARLGSWYEITEANFEPKLKELDDIFISQDFADYLGKMGMLSFTYGIFTNLLVRLQDSNTLGLEQSNMLRDFPIKPMQRLVQYNTSIEEIGKTCNKAKKHAQYLNDLLTLIAASTRAVNNFKHTPAENTNMIATGIFRAEAIKATQKQLVERKKREQEQAQKDAQLKEALQRLKLSGSFGSFDEELLSSFIKRKPQEVDHAEAAGADSQQLQQTKTSDMNTAKVPSTLFGQGSQLEPQLPDTARTTTPANQQQQSLRENKL